ncbi:MAG: DUF4381 family protein [Desulfobacula sp.]|nr:DUF4381 family protein [Desulfobacula sp.]
MQGFHDIRPPVPVGLDPMTIKLLLILLGVLLLAGILFFLIRKWWKNRKGIKDIQAVALPLSPFEEAAKELDSLAQRPMDDPRLFYFDLTLVLRRYMGRTFGFNAVEMTSEEVIREMTRLRLEHEVRKEIAQFQALSDPYKYAGVLPETALVKKDMDLVRGILLTIEEILAKKRQAEKREAEKTKEKEGS